MAGIGNGGKVAPTVRKDDASNAWASVEAFAVALLVASGCLNPRPEEVPSSLDPAPGGASDIPTAAAAPSEPSAPNATDDAARGGSPEPSGSSEAPAPEAAPAFDPAPSAPAPGALAPEPSDAGADAAPTDDAGAAGVAVGG